MSSVERITTSPGAPERKQRAARGSCLWSPRCRVLQTSVRNIERGKTGRPPRMLRGWARVGADGRLSPSTLGCRGRHPTQLLAWPPPLPALPLAAALPLHSNEPPRKQAKVDTIVQGRYVPHALRPRGPSRVSTPSRLVGTEAARPGGEGSASHVQTLSALRNS